MTVGRNPLLTKNEGKETKTIQCPPALLFFTLLVTETRTKSLVESKPVNIRPL